MVEEKKILKQKLSRGDYKLKYHAVIRMSQRCVTHQDIQKCGKTCKEKDIKYQPDKGTWLVKGKNLDGENLSVSCAIEHVDNLWVVTVYTKD